MLNLLSCQGSSGRLVEATLTHGRCRFIKSTTVEHYKRNTLPIVIDKISRI